MNIWIGEEPTVLFQSLYESNKHQRSKGVLLVASENGRLIFVARHVYGGQLETAVEPRFADRSKSRDFNKQFHKSS